MRFATNAGSTRGGASYYQIEGPRPRRLTFFEHSFASGVHIRPSVFLDQSDLDRACEDAASCIGSRGNSEGFSDFTVEVDTPEDCAAADQSAPYFFRVDYDGSTGGSRQVYNITVDMRTELTWPACW